MSRLADYFVVVGYDCNKERNSQGGGKILQRFPEKDWDNCPFTQGIELFCQPSGWQLSTQKQEPTFFVSTLTDIDAYRHYCACLTFSEDAAIEPFKEDDEDMEQDLALIRCSKVYAPKSLVLVSRLDYFEAFRNCLGIIYTVHIENMPVNLEILIGNILGCILVPLPGEPQIRFSIGAGDRQAIQPPQTSDLPVTRSSVALLFEQLGIANCLTIFCAALSDHKVLFHSRSYSRLTDSGHALTALMFPLKYSYVYIPLLPVGLLEVLSTPTPFIAGVHTSQKPESSDLLDVVVVDIDGGSIRIPENVHISLMPEPILSRMVYSLQLILQPELAQADIAFPSLSPKLPDSETLDKEIRAVFLRFFVELFSGYRSCLTIIRIHPAPVITFHKANFLGHRGLIDDEFTSRVLDSMSFNTFVGERGKPYRICDIFDEVFANMQEMLKTEESSQEKVLQNIMDLATKLYQNESPNKQPYVQKIPRPTEGAHLRVHQPIFPFIDPVKVAEIIEEGMARQAVRTRVASPVGQYAKVVPVGAHISAAYDKEHLVSANARRLEVLRNCVNFIFENRISDARKIFPAVLRALKSKVARLVLVGELSYNLRSNNRAMLEHQQFDLVVRLLNSALQSDSLMDEYGIAAAILPLATAFCRKLCTGVTQFAYTCLQEHPIWASQHFWETAFYQDVQQQIRELYLPQYESSSYPSSPKEGKDSGNGWMRDAPQRCDPKRWSVTQGSTSSATVRTRGISALEIAAEKLRVWQSLTAEQQAEMISNEESTVYSQAIHYANRIVYMRIPLDATKKIREPVSGMEGESLSSMVTNSVAESDSFDAESAIDDLEVNEVGAMVTKFVTRFIDKVCTESGVTADHIKSLHQIIPGVIAMHLEILEAVHQESKRLPPIQKPKILKPVLLHGEDLWEDGLRSYLLPDGREEGTGGNIGGPVLLPAEGALFLSNYRLIFKGAPCDPLACEQLVCRSFPISTLTKEKKMGAQYMSHIDQWLHEAVQLRSATFQLMKIAFDEEVSSEKVDLLKKTLLKWRNPPNVSMMFAFTGGHVLSHSLPIHKTKEKNASLKSFAKQTLLRGARRAGLKPKETKKRPKFGIPTPPMSRKMQSGGDPLGTLGNDVSPMFGDDLSVIGEQEILMQIQTDSKSIERLAERSYCKDYRRLGLGSLTASQSRMRVEPFRLTMVNWDYSVSQSYPAIVVVPQSISDDSVQKFARTHRQNRFPVVTWRHPVTKAVLLRASGFHGKGLIGMLKGHYNAPAVTPGSGESTSLTVEQEKYFAALVAATPMVHSVALSTVDSPMIGHSSSGNLLASHNYKNFQRVLSSFRWSTSRDTTSAVDKIPTLKADNALGRAATLQGHRPGSAAVSKQLDSPVMSKPNGTIDSSCLGGDIYGPGLRKATLYVLGEKTQMKGIRLESFKKCDFIPVDYYEIRQIKSSFKKLMRACVPSAPFVDPEKGFLKAVQESEWLNQIQNILQIAGAVIDLLDVQGSSVMVCLEDGWDFTTQVTSVAQILLDPYYRTFEGFQVLIEKEWLAFGYRFSHRSCQKTTSQTSGFAPIFLQFLDVIHQVHNQFPMSFEFNQYYLKFLAYHHVSNRFRTFMMDSEYRRMEAGWLLEESKLARTEFGIMDCDSLSSSRRVFAGMSVWEYIDQYHKKSPTFYNFLFVPHDHETVLRPFSNISNLKLWDYYLMEDLAHGSSYDFELLDDMQQDDELDITDLPINSGLRHIVNSCYDSVMQVVPDACSHLLQEINRLETEISGAIPTGWMQIWERLEAPPMEHLLSSRPLQVAGGSDHGRSTHKRSTIELLVRSKMLGETAKMFSQPHHFVQFNYTTPASCDYCSHILWGLIKTGMHCSDCGYNCHEKCMPHVPKNCTMIKPVSDVSNSSTNVSGGNISDSVSIATGTTEKDMETYPEFASSPAENRTHEGYLHKRGALLKGWKQRWFVLDSMKHQLRYYDTQEDSSCKGYIDLTDVMSVTSIKNVQGAPKKADENAFFELKTVRRVYQFLASDSRAAQEWVDKIQVCIQ